MDEVQKAFAVVIYVFIMVFIPLALFITVKNSNRKNK